MENNISPCTQSFTEEDIRGFLRYWIGPARLAANAERVSDGEARDKYGINGHGDHSGIAFLYRSWQTGHRVGCRLRVDHPPVEDGKPVRKYLCPAYDRRHLFIPVGSHGFVADKTIPAVLVESEKAALMLEAWSEYNTPLLPVAMGGCYGWRGRIGKSEDSRGHRIDEKGTLPDLRAVCSNREVTIALDANAATNPLVKKARWELTRELLAMNARVRIAIVPDVDGRVNGPDDLYMVCGAEAVTAMLNGAVLAQQLSVSEAEDLLRRVRNDESDPPNVALWKETMDSIARIHDKVQREVLSNRFAALTRGRLQKQTVISEIGARSAEQEALSREAMQEIEEHALRNRELDLQQLIDDLENFFVERAHIPAGGALVLAYFALNTYLFDVFDSTPYVALESATPRCGKSTLIRLLQAVGAKAVSATSMNEANLFRVVDEQRPLLLIDEAELLEARDDRARSLRAVLHEGYKVGSRVPRQVGENRETTKWFDIFCPKVFASIGGVSGALLDRCIPLHMERLPAGKKLRSCRIKVLKRDAAPLVENLKAFAIQCRGGAQVLYDAEPDEGYWPELLDREAELWGPLLIHARIIGKAAEEKLLDVVGRFIDQKSDIESEDSNVAKAIAMLEALESIVADDFTPGDLVSALEESEAWASTFSKVKSSDEKARHKLVTAKIGYFLRSFRLKSARRRTGKTYNRQTTIDVLRAHTPENLSLHSTHSQGNYSHPQVAENASDVDGVNTVNAFQDTARDRDIDTQNHPQCPGCGERFEDITGHMLECGPCLEQEREDA